MSKWYGNVTNRIEEGRQFAPIEVGTDITMYYWSDRTCYYVTDVIDEKHIKVKPYHVCANHDKANGMGHQEWMYFKSRREENEYLKRYFPDHEYSYGEDDKECWTFRYGKWMREVTFTKDNHCTEREKKSLVKNGYYKRYYDLSGKVSFGVRDYYYDWEF